MTKRTYKAVRNISIFVSLFCILQLYLGWLDYRCFFHRGASVIDNLKQYINNTWAIIYFIFLLLAIVGIIISRQFIKHGLNDDSLHKS